MAHVTAFRALRYDPARVPIAEVVTQPYDKITPEMQDRYYQDSPYNLVKIILGKRTANDGPEDNPYTRAASFYQQWRKEGVFLQEQQPSVYTYSQRFTPPGGGAERERRGFIALGKIEDYSAGVVFRHEQTLAKPKADRLDLLRATRAHFGQIFMLYSDPAAEIEAALAAVTTPLVELSDEYGVLHCLGRVSDPDVLSFVQQKMRDKQLIIADGHHRYETALNYRNERRQQAGAGAEPAPYDFVMMTFVNMDDPALLILPTHRVVHSLPSFSMDALRQGASEFFTVEEVDPSIDSRRATIILRECGHTGTSLLAVGRDRALLFCRPKAPESAFKGFSLRQQSLDVVQLHQLLLSSVLGLSEESIRNQENVSYIRDAGEAITMVREGKADVAFLMNPVRIGQMRDVALAGEVLPQKSTDFYPKLLSGLTIYALE